VEVTIAIDVACWVLVLAVSHFSEFLFLFLFLFIFIVFVFAVWCFCLFLFSILPLTLHVDVCYEDENAGCRHNPGTGTFEGTQAHYMPLKSTMSPVTVY
jgi:hypothetical protein